jgi:hypothetical protein
MPATSWFFLLLFVVRSKDRAMISTVAAADLPWDNGLMIPVFAKIGFRLYLMCSLAKSLPLRALGKDRSFMPISNASPLAPSIGAWNPGFLVVGERANVDAIIVQARDEVANDLS